MSDRIKWLDHQGHNPQTLFLIDLSRLRGRELIQSVQEIDSALDHIDDRVDFLIDVQGMTLNFESLSFLKAAGKKVQSVVRKSAIVGFSKPLKPFFVSYLKYTGSNMQIFQTRDDAINYFNESLVSLPNRQEEPAL